ncbi:MAG: PspA/IM30 family protein [Phototrophicaceae bacterium]
MPDGFFNKLNTLVQAHVNNIIDPIDEKMSKSRKKALSRQDIRGGLQKDVKVLRQRIQEALDYESTLQSKADALYTEVAEWDTKANAAVADGRENDARFALGRMQQAQRELEMTEADLQEHRTITQELISQVNMLDSTIQAASDVTDSDADQDIPVNVKSKSSSSAPNVEEIGSQIVQQLDSTRQNLSNLISDYTSKVMGDDEPRQMPEVNEPPTRSRPAPTTHPVNRGKVDDEYSARLSRLSKPDDTK